LSKGEKYGYTYSYPPPYTQQLGLFSIPPISGEDVLNFISQIPEQYKYIEMNLNTQNPFNSNLFETKKGVTHLLNLNESYANILANYSTQTKRNLKKAQALLLTIAKDTAPGKIIELFRGNRGKEYSHNPEQYATLEKLMHACIKMGIGQSRGVYLDKNELCAGAFFLQSHGRVIFLFSGVNEKGYNAQAMTFLLNTYIEEHAGNNLIFDFDGSSDTNIARFYSGFGSQKVEFFKIRRNTLSPPMKWIKEIQFKRKA
ncbi:MAG TPA: GNAT family N-acetyltransferase, partial [Bacteroidia bacterium]|nr:GNAT family N-acetyltransferase [Bacteroidia bacterium]